MNKSKTTPQYVRFDKDMTNIVKGFAIIFMMFLHCYPDSPWYIISLDFSHSPFKSYEGAFKICVDMFTFMVGYGYAFSKKKDFKYSLQHIKKLFIPFWLILFVFTVPICYKQIICEDITTIIYNLFGIDSTYCLFSWFVYFFIFTMIVMPFISRIIDKKPLRNTIIVIIASIALAIIVHETPRICSILFNVNLPRVIENKLAFALFQSLILFPGTALGYLFAHRGYYERVRIDQLPRIWIIVISVTIMVMTMILSHLTVFPDQVPFRHDFFWAPIIIGAIVVLFNAIKWQFGRWLFIKLGMLSVYMWFFHALFFTEPIKEFYQPMITIFSNINYVVLWAIFLTFCMSWIIKSFVDKITDWIGKISQH